ncbi:hypothetical protein CspeluHIS016_0700500 [Cutaneotrichosporon spelunceum]|uniref:Uncharacterized protein n=1 Tax=Cutaneotrichosporon spelunceum TaxID=1672016 RepID=A0AAD3TYY7_9TREE|nr:hypothetical protein CspeluHIS016_0700500 [Cutaneotrichosporon spelunceum]
MPVIPFSVAFKKRKRAPNTDAPPSVLSSRDHHLMCSTPQAGPSHVHAASDATLITPSPLRAVLADSDPVDEYRYNGVEELADEQEYIHEAETPPSFADHGNSALLGDEELLSRLLHREREYTRLQVYYEELYRRYAGSKDQIEHLNRQIDALSARLERKERRIRLLKVLAIRK